MIFSIFAMYAPMKNLTRLQNQIVQARAASERAFALLATQSSVPEPSQPRLLRADNADIQFDCVHFSYGEKIALHEINLQIESGQLVALVGASGSGKTTLSNLLLRFYDPQQGAVKIGGTDIREVSTRDLRNHIAVVTQENVLFNETVRRNIELGCPGATNEEIIAAAKHAHAHQFILEKPHGYETVIGEKGVTLSGGQRQRIAIARAVLRNAPILILDEATSALDTESERAVQAALDELMKGRTTFCIAHRLSTILARRFDRRDGPRSHCRDWQARRTCQARRRLPETLRTSISRVTHPFITVAICTRNRAALLQKAVRSVLPQLTGRAEILIVDNDSTDDTAKIAAEFTAADARVRFFRESQPGISIARNTALRRAAGVWVIFLDDDAEVEPGWLAAYEAFFARLPAAKIAAAGGAVISRYEIPPPKWMNDTGKMDLSPESFLSSLRQPSL